MKAFAPAKLPFPLLHVDTTWKFREMIAFRDATVRRLGLDLIVHINEDGVARRHRPVQPRQRRPYRRDEDARPAAGARALQVRCGDRRGAARRGKIARQGAGVLAPHRRPSLGSEEPAARALAAATTAGSRRAKACGCSRCPIGPSSMSGTTSRAEDIPVVPLYFAAAPAGGGARRRAASWSTTTAFRPTPGETAGTEAGPLPHAWLLSADRRHRVRTRRRSTTSSTS